MLFSIYLICGFQVKFSSNGTPRNLIDSAQLIIFNLGSKRKYHRVYFVYGEMHILFYFILSEGLLEINH